MSSITPEATVRIGDRVIAQAALKQRAARAAAAMVAAGVQHGERVALVLRNDPEFLTLSAAAGFLGAVPVPVNWHWRGEELRHVLSHSGARAVFVHSDLVPGVEEVLGDGVALIEVPVPAELTAPQAPGPPSGRHVLIDDWLEGHEPYSEPL